MKTSYNLDKIKFSVGEATFKRAVNLYETGKVMEIEQMGGHYSAIVRGTEPYRVSVSAQNFKYGHCTCYLGQKSTLCKHMIALAIHAVMDGRPLSDSDKQCSSCLKCSGRREAMNKEKLEVIKKAITESMKYIKPYHGPSRTWFANQDSLREGCNRLSAILSDLPVNKETAEILVKLLLRLDKKLCVGGVDDSNGIVGGFMNEIVHVLQEFAQIEPDCIKTFNSLLDRQTCFGWEDPLIRILDEESSLR